MHPRRPRGQSVGSGEFEHFRPAFSPDPTDCPWVSEDAVKATLGTLRNYDADGKENVKIARGLMRKTTTLHVHHAFLYISLLSLHNYDAK